MWESLAIHMNSWISERCGGRMEENSTIFILFAYEHSKNKNSPIWRKILKELFWVISVFMETWLKTEGLLSSNVVHTIVGVWFLIYSSFCEKLFDINSCMVNIPRTSTASELMIQCLTFFSIGVMILEVVIPGECGVLSVPAFGVLERLMMTAWVSWGRGITPVKLILQGVCRGQVQREPWQ